MDQTYSPQLISGLGNVANCYQGFLLDAWGVLHDGVRTYPGVIDTLQALQRSGKTVLILSNAARRANATMVELAHAGIEQDLYQAVVCSGELTWQALWDNDREPFLSLGRRAWYLGTERSRGLLAGLDLELVVHPQEASFILNTGVPQGYEYTLESVEPLLQSLLSLGLPMLCANPDLVAIRGGVMGISAGSIAARYEQLGAGPIYRVGKPDPRIYAEAMQKYSNIAQSEWLAIGDAFATDIRGAGNVGLDSLLVAGGIHQQQLLPLENDKVMRMATEYRCCPKYYCQYLRW